MKVWFQHEFIDDDLTPAFDWNYINVKTDYVFGVFRFFIFTRNFNVTVMVKYEVIIALTAFVISILNCINKY